MRNAHQSQRRIKRVGRDLPKIEIPAVWTETATGFIVGSGDDALGKVSGRKGHPQCRWLAPHEVRDRLWSDVQGALSADQHQSKRERQSRLPIPISFIGSRFKTKLKNTPKTKGRRRRICEAPAQPEVDPRRGGGCHSVRSTPVSLKYLLGNIQSSRFYLHREPPPGLSLQSSRMGPFH
jgi:hypothetical protein